MSSTKNSFVLPSSFPYLVFLSGLLFGSALLCFLAGQVTVMWLNFFVSATLLSINIYRWNKYTRSLR